MGTIRLGVLVIAATDARRWALLSVLSGASSSSVRVGYAAFGDRSGGFGRAVMCEASLLAGEEGIAAMGRIPHQAAR